MADDERPPAEPDQPTAELPPIGAPTAAPAQETEVLEPVGPIAPVEAGAALAARRRRPRWIIPVVVIVVVLGILAALLVLAQGAIRERIEGEIADRFRSALGLSATTEVDVAVATDRPLLVQLAGQSLDRVDIDVPEIELNDLTGAVHLRVEGVHIFDEFEPVRALDASFTVDEAELSGIATSLSGIDADSVTLDAPEIVVSTELTVFGVRLPFSVGIEPGATDGDLTFEPTTIRWGDEQLTVAELRGNPFFSGIASAVLQQRSVCVADRLPASLVLDSASVEGSQLVLGFTGDGAVLGDLSTLGTCS